MFLIKANIELINDTRKLPIQGKNYRPLLIFSKSLIRSGHLFLRDDEVLDMTKFYENRLISIYFYDDLDTKVEFYAGRKFKLSEGSNIIGYGLITEIIGVN